MQKNAIPLAVFALISNASAIKVGAMAEAQFGFTDCYAPAKPAKKSHYQPAYKSSFKNHCAPCEPVVACCPDCPCEEEFEDLQERLGGIGSSISSIIEEQEGVTGRLETIQSNQEANTLSLDLIAANANDALDQINALNEAASTPNQGGTRIEVICVDSTTTPDEGDVVDVDLGNTEDIVEDPLLARDNLLEDEEVYSFSQNYPVKNCDTEFFLMSAAINFNDSSFDDKVHGKQVDSDELTQAAAAVRFEKDDLDFYFNWQFDTTQADLIDGVEGGQLVDKDGFCLGYTEVDNYEGDDGLETRIQTVDCVTVTDPEDLEQVDALLRQLWSAELGEASDLKRYIRNIGTEKVIKKVIDSQTFDHADEVYTGQKSSKVYHFDLALVDKTECVHNNDFNVNDCLWTPHVVSFDDL